MALQGTLDTFALPDVLRLLAATKKSGQLQISADRGSGTVGVDGGAIASIEAPHVPLATELVDALFELLRFREGSFTFDPDAEPGGGTTSEVEPLLEAAEALLEEWRLIEAVVPSVDAWVSLRAELDGPEVGIDQQRWATVVAVGAGATVAAVGDALHLPELAACRAIRDLVDLGLADVAESVPERAPVALHAVSALDEVEPVEQADSEPPSEASDPERFVPLDLGLQQQRSYDHVPEEAVDPHDELEVADVHDLAAAFPGLADRVGTVGASADDDSDDPDDVELARQLSTLSPKAAEAVRAAARAASEEARGAALDDLPDSDEEPLDRGLLLKFLSSVKG